MKVKKRVVVALVGAAVLILGAVLEVDLSGFTEGLTSIACSVVECTQ